ncbi:mannitol dehydrogenase family protein [Rhizobacter sp. AJA081-3]|uniref:mannitol dehydrogenase family protein n=1 Tax=Rhizobacter sp. AJA081-3 TaxID=2753607 RepID=UPI001FD82224|nr:mannitol dehydrogenase family protein [Rhizobacter sp. AJA081-3]
MTALADKAGLSAGIVHLGLGAFARAHLIPATEAAMAASGERDWGVLGVSLRHADVRDALESSRFDYTLALRDADAHGTPRERRERLRTLLGVLVAPEDPQAVLDAIAAPATRIVSLTVTEKGYHHDPATGALKRDDPGLAHDLAHPHSPRTTLGFLVHGLALRHARGLGPVTLLSCDNLPSNGATLRGLVLAFAAQVDARLADWIASTCRFPNDMVDRIVPRNDDLTVVTAEPFFDWAIEDDFAAGRPDWTVYGARFVVQAEPFEKLKLRMVNGAHSTIAYLGVVAGWATVDCAIREPALRRAVDAMMREEIEPTLHGLADLDLAAYRARLLDRFANPALAHRTRQIAMDGSQKIPQRWLGTVRDRLAAGAPIDRLALAVAAWLHFLQGVDEAGKPYQINDPLAAELAALQARAATQADEIARVATLCDFAPVFGALGGDRRFIEAVARHTASLRERGVLSTLESLQ